MNLSGADCYDEHIDIGRELSTLHTLLRESLLQTNIMHQTHPSLKTLPKIIDSLNYELTQSFRAGAAATLNDAVYATYLSREVQEQLLAKLQNMHSNCKDCQESAAVAAAAVKLQQHRPASANLNGKNNYLLGSSQRPARNLNTADDYVLFSAIDDNRSAGKSECTLKGCAALIVAGSHCCGVSDLGLRFTQSKQNCDLSFVFWRRENEVFCRTHVYGRHGFYRVFCGESSANVLLYFRWQKELPKTQRLMHGWCGQNTPFFLVVAAMKPLQFRGNTPNTKGCSV